MRPSSLCMRASGPTASILLLRFGFCRLLMETLKGASLLSVSALLLLTRRRVGCIDFKDGLMEGSGDISKNRATPSTGTYFNQQSYSVCLYDILGMIGRYPQQTSVYHRTVLRRYVEIGPLYVLVSLCLPFVPHIKALLL